MRIDDSGAALQGIQEHWLWDLIGIRDEQDVPLPRADSRRLQAKLQQSSSVVMFSGPCSISWQAVKDKVTDLPDDISREIFVEGWELKGLPMTCERHPALNRHKYVDDVLQLSQADLHHVLLLTGKKKIENERRALGWRTFRKAIMLAELLGALEMVSELVMNASP